MNKVLLLIDGDSLIFHSLRETINESLLSLDEKIQNIFDKTGGTHYVIFISQGKYFRHNIDSNYKLSREKYRDKPKWVKTLKGYLIENWNAQWMDGVEADDLVAYWMNKELVWGEWLSGNTLLDKYNFSLKEYIPSGNYFEKIEKIICSPDKDLLQSIPVKHFNYSYKLENKDDPNSVIKGWWVETTQEDVTNFYGKQLLMGDSADGIPALNRIGEARAAKILENWQDGMLETFILDYYIEYYKGDVPKAIFEFQKTYRLLHMLDCDEDFMREVGVLPPFPNIYEIIDKKKEEMIEEF